VIVVADIGSLSLGLAAREGSPNIWPVAGLSVIVSSVPRADLFDLGLGLAVLATADADVITAPFLQTPVRQSDLAVGVGNVLGGEDPAAYTQGGGCNRIIEECKVPLFRRRFSLLAQGRTRRGRRQMVS
jgi:hypothetical protein